MCRYDPAADAWESVEEMGARRSGCGVGVVEGALYAVGGHDGPAVRRSVERWAGAGWAAAPPMHTARRNAAVAAHHGRLYVVGGDDGAANLNTVEVRIHFFFPLSCNLLVLNILWESTRVIGI